MAAEDETSMIACLDLYKSQLSQVESSLEMGGESSSDHADLVQLRIDLNQLIELTEGSLISLKKSKLLSLLSNHSAADHQKNESVSTSSISSTSVIDGDVENFEANRKMNDRNMDNEFEAFKLAVSEYDNDVLISQQQSMPVDVSDQDTDNESNQSLSIGDMSGQKCRVSYAHSWGEMTEHNAMIIGTEPSEGQSSCTVRVVFLNPTHCSMRPCPYFLDAKCRFSDLECRYSHGEVVLLDDLKPFKEPDFSSIKIGSHCLALDTDSIWYPATVVDVLPENQFNIQYDATHVLAVLDLHNICPIDEVNDLTADDEVREYNYGDNDCVAIESDDDDDDDDDNKESHDNSISGTDSPMIYIRRENQTTDALGQWERYTKGIGSKLMAKMGYIVGQGLGRNCEGRAEPVPIELLPQGKSLDQIMELRSLAKGKDLHKAMRKQKQMKKKLNQAATVAAGSKTTDRQSNISVFDFINSKLNSSKRTSATRHDAGRGFTSTSKNITVNDLKSKSDSEVNVQLFKTQEEIKSAKNEIRRLEASLARNEKQDQVIAKQVQNKLASMHKYVQQIENSKLSIQQHISNRKAHNTLTKF